MTQLEIIREKLESDGAVSRNWALQNYISRLGAIIYKLKEMNYNITGQYINKDYIYIL